MRYRFAAIPYANAMPLVHFLPQVCYDAEIVYLKPAHVLHEMNTQKVDSAILPVADYFKESDVQMVEGLGICVDGPVESVLLQCNCPLKAVKTVQLDPASKTSNVLIKILMAEHFHISRDIVYGFDIGDPDASVCIGDRALLARPSVETYDLAYEWKNMTGLPFVFALWVYKSERSDGKIISDILHRAKLLGCNAIEEIARLCSRRLNLPYEKCWTYLTERLHYDLGRREYESIELFRELSNRFISSKIIAVPVAGTRKRKEPNVSISK